jgi:hypothetical protein
MSVDYDKTKFYKDEYGNLYPKNEPNTSAFDLEQAKLDTVNWLQELDGLVWKITDLEGGEKQFMNDVAYLADRVEDVSKGLDRIYWEVVKFLEGN